ncbi:hypothetical protein D3C87_1826360 [compost metagenome]
MGFRNPVGPHQPPFVMIPGQPGFSQVAEGLVFIDFLRVEVAMVIDDRHGFGMIMKEQARCFTGQQKIVI